MKNDKYLICFDLDGVLIHSMQASNRIFFDTVEQELGLPTEEHRKNIKMMSISVEEKFYIFWKNEIAEKGITNSQIEETIKKYRQEKISAKMPILPNAIETVKLIANNFDNIAAVSSNKLYIIDETLKRLNIRNYFKKLTGIDNIRFSKPHPEIYQKTVEYFGLDPKNALTFEDSENGINSAKEAGMKVIAVATGLESYEELKKTKADLVLNDLTELKLEMVYNLFGISEV